tara:strand:- start:1631 stop:1927 length:297 start_codon:yes stop_codon:yes gene_type:complete
MIVSIFALLVFYYLSKYISNKIIEIKTDNKKENDTNFWMFTYDFKEKKKESIFDKESKEILYNRRKKNNLIVLLYITHAAIFIYVNYFLSQILILILR